METFPHRVIEQAANDALDSFDRQVTDKLMAPGKAHTILRKRVYNDYDRVVPFSIPKSMETLDKDREKFRELGKDATNFARLYELLDSYVFEATQDLFFRSNDFPTARMRRDLLTEVIGHISKELKARHLLSDEEVRELEIFPDLFDLVLVSYMEMRDEIHDRTDGLGASLVEWAQEDLLAQKKHIDGASVEARARQIFDILLGDKGLGRVKDAGSFHPAFISLANEAIKTAKREIKNEYGDRYEAASEEELNAKIVERFYELMVGMQQAANGDVRQAGLTKLQDYIEERRLKAWGLPKDYDKMMERAHKKAGAVSLSRLPGRHAAWVKEDEAVKTNSDKYTEANGLDMHSLSRSEQVWKNECLSRLEPTVVDILNFEELPPKLETAADSIADDVFFGSAPPVLLTVMQDYLRQLSINLRDAMKERNLPIKATLDKIELVEEKLAHYEDAYAITGDICFKVSGQAYKSPSLWALFNQCSARSKHYAQLTPQERGEIPEEALEIFTKLSAEVGIPKPYRSDPLAPLIFEECMQRVISEPPYSIPIGASARFADKIAFQHRGPQEQATVDRTHRRLTKEAIRKGQELFLTVMKQFPELEREDGSKRPNYTAADLHRIMEFFDSTPARGAMN